MPRATRGYLVVSSQGNNSYALFDRRSPHQYRGSVAIGHNSAKGIDGTSDTDGIAVTSAHLGERFPPRASWSRRTAAITAPRAPQNFKIGRLEQCPRIAGVALKTRSGALTQLRLQVVFYRLQILGTSFSQRATGRGVERFAHLMQAGGANSGIGFPKPQAGIVPGQVKKLEYIANDRFSAARRGPS